MQCIKTRIEWLKRIIAALTGTCIYGDAVMFINKDCRVLVGDTFIVPFLGPALGWTAMCSPGWGNLFAIDWNDLPVGREFDGKFWKNFKSPPYALPPPAGRRLNIDRCIIIITVWHHIEKLCGLRNNLCQPHQHHTSVNQQRISWKCSAARENRTC